MDKPNQPFMVRLRPDTRALLDRAAGDQRRSRASIIDQLLRDSLQKRYSDSGDKIERWLRAGV